MTHQVKLNERQRAVLFASAGAVLEELAPQLQCAMQVSEALSAVVSVIQAACSNFAESWNTTSLMRRLPFEVFAACLYAADLPTRIYASQVSRAWRTVALSERGLWANFSCTPFATYRDQLRTFEILKIMLNRSMPLPFRLSLPHNAVGYYGEYEHSITSAIAPEMHRLQAYDGPLVVFCPRNTKCEPLLALTSFSCLDRGNPYSWRSTEFSITQELDGRRLPNLRRLVCPPLKFRAGASPYNCLQELVCTFPANDSSKDLFRCCPNLDTAEFISVRDTAVLPRPPCPSTLRHITIHGEPDRDDGQDGADFAPLAAWSGHVIPQLTLFGAQSLHYATTHFIAQHGASVGLRMAPRSPNITLFTVDGSERCEITTCAFWSTPSRIVKLLVPLSGLLAHLTVCSKYFYAFFNARIHAPRLVFLELSLYGAIDDAFPAGAFIRAPGLRDFTLDIRNFDNDAQPHASFVDRVLDALRSNFRSLVVYDSDLLETLTIRCTAAFAKDIRCTHLAQFARQFIRSEC